MNGNKYEVALHVVQSKLLNRESFSFEEIQDEILQKGGILQVAFATTVGSYIEDLCDDGLLKFNRFTKKFDVVRNAKNQFVMTA